MSLSALVERAGPMFCTPKGLKLSIIECSRGIEMANYR